MNRNLGLSAGMLALLAIMVHLSPIGSEQTGEKGDSQSNGQKSARPDRADDKSENLRDITEGPWYATRALFGQSSNQESRQGAPAAKAQATSVPDFGIPPEIAVVGMIATVPDPWHTRLALFTDGTLDAIEASATSDSWIFAGQWLPWADPIDPGVKDPVRRRYQRARASDQEDQPGVLVFRHAITQAEAFDHRVLLVFVVGETPTGGVNRTQFHNAREYLEDVGTDKCPVFILAPSFSGSFLSLQELLAEDGQTTYIVRNGDAASVPDAEAFKCASNVAFRSANTSSDDFRDFFLRTLSALRIQPNKAAVLAEDETRIGSVAQAAVPTKREDQKPPEDPGSCAQLQRNRSQEQAEDTTLDEVLKLKFPRDISQLRNAYRDTKSSMSDNGVPAEVQFSLKDNELGEDSIPSYSSLQGPLSQNSRLEEDLDLIRRNQIEAVELIATNALDALFLARVIQQKSPDTRIVLPYGNLLFVEAARSEGLRNVLALSGYPLLRERSWWQSRKGPLLTYPDSLAEGAYNAMSLLLDDMEGRSGSERGKHLDDYWWKAQLHPPVWLLTLDREGFLPVRAWLHEHEEREVWWEKIPVPKGRKTPPEEISAEPSAFWDFAMGSVSLAAMAVMILSMALWTKDNPRLDGRFVPVAIRRDGWRLVYVFNFFLLFAAMEVTLGLPWMMLGRNIAARLGLAEAVILVLFAMFIMVAWFRYNRRASRKQAAGWAMLASLVPFAAGIAVWKRAIFCPTDSAGLFFSLRAVELRSGSSPALPILAALFALIIYCYGHLHRLYLSACQEPSFVTNLPTVLAGRLKQSGCSLSAHFRSPTGLVEMKEWANVAAGFAVAFVLGFWLDPHRLTSVDGWGFNVLLISLQCLLVAALLLSCVQMKSLWADLRVFLAALGTLPLATFFIARSGNSGNRPIWVQNLNLQSLSTLVRGPIVLHDVVLKSREVIWQDREDIQRRYDKYIAQVRKLIAGEAATRIELLKQNARANRMSVTITETLFERIIVPRWLSLPLVGKQEAAPDKEYRAETEPAGRVGIPGEPDSISDLAQTFVALHFTPFLLYTVKQIRGIIWFLSLGFVCLALSMNADSPQSPQVISRFLLFLFVIIGAVLWRCLSGIERDPIISRIEGTKPGELNVEFYIKLLGYVALPALGLLASEFPSIANFVFSWVEPTLTAVK